MFILETTACETASFLATILFIKNLVKIASIIVPAILVLLLSMDLGKAVISGDEEGMKKAQKLAIKRVISALIVFFVPIIVDASFKLIDSSGLLNLDCYTNATEEKVEELVAKEKEKASKNEEERKKAVENTKKNKEKLTKEQESSRQKAIKNAEKAAKTKKNVNSSSNGAAVDTTNSSYKGKAKLSKTYSSFKVLDTLEKKDFEKKIIVSITTNPFIAQSFTVVNNYFVVSYVNRPNTASSVGVYDKSSGKRVKTYSGFSLGHANGMTYNASSGNIYVTHGLLSRNKVHKFSGNNIASRKSIGVSSFTVSRGVSGVSYDDATGKLYYASGPDIFEYKNKSLKHVADRKKFVFGQSQDICVYNGIIYDININGGNRIDMFKVNGQYLGSYKVGVGYELESIDYYGTGNKMALLFYSSGSHTHYIYIIDTIMPSE